MKKGLFLVILAAILVSCASNRSLNLNKLTTGMTKAQVEAISGPPNRVLAVNRTDDGFQEILEFRTSRGDSYALEFWDDYLTGFEFLQDNVVYVAPPMMRPMHMPPHGRPIIVIRSDNRRPNRPGTARPPQNVRPGQSTRSTSSSDSNSTTSARTSSRSASDSTGSR